MNEETEDKGNTELTDEQLAERTEEQPADGKPKKKEDMVPATVVGTVRKRARAAELEVARLTGEIEGRKVAEAKAKPPEKSPIELAAEAQEVSVDKVEIDGALYRKQRKWEKAQEAAKAEEEATQKQVAEFKESYRQAQIGEFSAEKVGLGLDLDTILAMGGPYLTLGDKLDIGNAGAKNAPKTAYKICIKRILESGSGDAKILKQRLAAHKKAQAELKKKKTDEPDEEVPSQETILGKTDIGTAHIHNVFDIK